MRASRFAIAGAAVATACAVPSAFAGDTGGGNVPEGGFTAGVTIHYVAEDEVMRGRVFSDSDECRERRRVKIFGSYNDDFVYFAFGRTNDRGRYRIGANTKDARWPAGEYYAKLPAKPDCARARSQKITILVP
jgi:hypothetical protein